MGVRGERQDGHLAGLAPLVSMRGLHVEALSGCERPEGVVGASVVWLTPRLVM